MSCGMIALDQLGFTIDKYYASEIDPYAIKVSKHNYPNIIHIGDILNVDVKNIENIDLIIGGSPCQGFSFAGKHLNFEDPRSRLFFEFVRLLKDVRSYNPNVKFFLENVFMKQIHQDIISEHLGVQPIEINSRLVSGQLRRRLYWTNIECVTMPEDLYISLYDIIDSGFVDRDKAFCIDANYWKGSNPEQYLKKSRRQLVFCDNEVVPFGFKSFEPMVISNRLATGFRKLTPNECEELQNVPKDYTNCVSNTQRYKMLGNGWTINVIKHILSFLNHA
jgi:site-specific DNA-cytosine methylase